MTLVAEMMLKGNQYKPLARVEQHQLISVLMEELLDGLPAPVRSLFEAASVFWRFNEERLASILSEGIDQEALGNLSYCQENESIHGNLLSVFEKSRSPIEKDDLFKQNPDKFLYTASRNS